MKSKELKSLLRSSFPTLKKPWLGRDVIECRDGVFPVIQHHIYLECDQHVWSVIEKLGIQYGQYFPDCDDFSDIKNGEFKKEWWNKIVLGLVPEFTAPSYAVCDGYNPQGENHNFNLFYSDMGLFVSDYGEIKPIDGYRPMRVRF